MIGRHPFQRLAADDPGAVEFAAIEQHLREAGVVHGGGDKTAAAGFDHRLFEHVEELDFVAGPGIGREGLGQPVSIFVAGVKGGFGHLQRRQDAFAQKRAERLCR